MVKKNILLLDDHLVIRKGMITLLNDFYTNLHFFEASNDTEALDLLKNNDIDLIVIDLQLPKTDTIQLIELITIKYPGSFILVFSMLSEVMYGRRVFKAGASGFLNKDAAVEEVKRAFDHAFARKRYISEQLLEVLAQDLTGHIPANPFEKLSHREFAIIHLLLNGKSISEISKRLNIKPSTVGTYKSRILDKLHVSSLLELNSLAVQYGISGSLTQLQ